MFSGSWWSDHRRLGNGFSLKQALIHGPSLSRKYLKCYLPKFLTINYLVVWNTSVRTSSPTEKEEHEEECKEDIEHDDEGEETVGYEREATVLVVRGNCGCCVIGGLIVKDVWHGCVVDMDGGAHH